MRISTAHAVWDGGLKDGRGTMRLASGPFNGNYTYATRFEEAAGTNPEELIAAAHAGCYSMALSAELGNAGFKSHHIETEARVTMDKVDGKNGISQIHLDTQAQVPGIDEAAFQKIAEAAKAGCPVSRALKAVDISLSARLVSG